MTNGFIFSKIFYYMTSLWTLLVNLKNPFVLFGYFLQRGGNHESKNDKHDNNKDDDAKTVTLSFKNGITLKTTQPMDALIIKETIFDDAYGLLLLKKPTYVLDVGGAMGDLAIFAAKLYSKAEVVVFEPNPLSFPILQENIKANKASNVMAVEAAVGTQSQYAFYIAEANVRSSVIKDSWSKKKITVKGVALDKYIKKEVDLLKIDTEGGEVDILKSIKPASFKKIKRIVCEYHRHLVKNQDTKIRDLIAPHNFDIEIIPDPYNSDIGYVVADRKS